MVEAALIHNSGGLSAIVPVLIIALAMLFMGWINRNFDYECAGCGRRFSLSFWQAALSPHMMGRKFVRCPGCGRRGWAAAIRRQ